MIPQEDDTNADMRSKIKRLVPHMRKKLVEARLIYKKGTSNASVRNTALQISYQFPGIIKVLDQSIGGGGKIEEAEEILRGGNNYADNSNPLAGWGGPQGRPISASAPFMPTPPTAQARRQQEEQQQRVGREER